MLNAIDVLHFYQRIILCYNLMTICQRIIIITVALIGDSAYHLFILYVFYKVFFAFTPRTAIIFYNEDTIQYLIIYIVVLFSVESGGSGNNLQIFNPRQPPKKKRKSRTAFTNHQIFELEKRFLYQKYLSPADRDDIAQQLGLTNAQVII